MKIVPVDLKMDPYKVFIGENILHGLGPQLKKMSFGKNCVIISHPFLLRTHGKFLIKGLERSGFKPKVMEVPEGEKSKSVKVAFGLMEQIARYDVMKAPFIIAFGGGVIGDLTGYVASAYKRGVPYIQVPTTFLAQIDSAIGGKVGIDLAVGKNLVGAFYQPGIVWSDVAVLKTLPQRQIKNGLAEAVKYGIIYDKTLFEYLATGYREILCLHGPALVNVVARSVKIKSDVVEKDEKETKGLRTILNFGHTVGHAIEAAGGFRAYQHGEAIALGMRVAAEISCRLKMLNRADSLKINELLSAIGLPERIQNIGKESILKLMQHDKKFVSGKNRFVLALRIGKVKVVEGVPLKTIEGAIESYLD